MNIFNLAIQRRGVGFVCISFFILLCFYFVIVSFLKVENTVPCLMSNMTAATITESCCPHESLRTFLNVIITIIIITIPFRLGMRTWVGHLSSRQRVKGIQTSGVRLLPKGSMC
uniref:Uncharacterized protein n=1 Tax=Trypanosoma vivax (strain Y486) TaxID=1055687 RepID=G0U2J6_TRYVY|nr:hypothetical protein TVY486_0903200 [Trypanosoma vivax Y486]